MNEIVAAEAYELDDAIHQCNLNVRANFLKMAELLYKMREEKLYLALDYETFESYLGSLSAEGNRAWLYRLIRAWEKFSKQLSIPDYRLLEIGPSKLDVIANVVNEENKDEWLNKAAALSKSDVISEVRQAQGKHPISSLPAKAGHINPGLADLLKYKTYLDYVREQPCCVCGSTPVDAHHFPQGRVRTDNRDKVVPLCRNCHQEYHQNRLKWLNDYAAKWGDYFYSFIFRIWKDPE